MDGVSRSALCIIFGLKVLSGILYGILHKNYNWGGDTFVFFKHACLISETFPDHPGYYLKSLVGIESPAPMGAYDYPAPYDYFSSFGMYSVMHVHALVRVVSFGYYDVHVMFMAGLSLFAGTLLFRVLRQAGGLHDKVLSLGVFLVPSLVFWTSGLHKDGFIYFGLALVLHATYNLSRQKQFRGGLLFQLFFGLLLVAAFRFYLLALLLPALVALYWALAEPTQALRRFGIVYGAGILAVLLLHVISNRFDPLRIVAAKQGEFAGELGGSDFSVPPLSPTLWGFVRFFPEALFNALFRPFIEDCHYLLQYISSLEMMLFVFGLAGVIFFYRKAARKQPLHYFLLFYALSNFALIGYLLSNSGTIARYRCVALSFLVIYLMIHTDYEKLARNLGLKLDTKSDARGFASGWWNRL